MMHIILVRWIEGRNFGKFGRKLFLFDLALVMVLSTHHYPLNLFIASDNGRSGSLISFYLVDVKQNKDAEVTLYPTLQKSPPQGIKCVSSFSLVKSF